MGGSIFVSIRWYGRPLRKATPPFRAYLSTNTTQEHYAEFGWRPTFFNLSSTDSPQTLLETARSMAEEKVRLYDYELTGSKRAALEEIMDRARKRAYEIRRLSFGEKPGHNNHWGG